MTRNPLVSHRPPTAGLAALLPVLVPVLLLAVLAIQPARSQTGAGTGLSGRAMDETELPIPGVEVTVRHEATEAARTTTTDESGRWEVRFLSPGPYSVRFAYEGFKTLNREGIHVTTAEMSDFDVALELGDYVVSVTVTADAPMITANSAANVRTLDRWELEGLPISSRNFTQLLLIEPGVSADISELVSNNNASVSPSVNGARTTNNSFFFNGIDVTNLLCCSERVNGNRGSIDEGGGSLSRNLAPAPETLQEVKLQASLYDAATGRNGGGNFQLVSSGGSNQFHGSIYHFFQNEKLTANDFFFNRAGVERPILRRNEGGFTIGGPIRRNKTFFFGSYQATRALTSFIADANRTVRMPQALSDDRSDEGINGFARALGVDNVAEINPTSRQLLQAQFDDGSYLIPSGSNGFNCETSEGQKFASCQVLSIIPAPYRQDQFSVNVDHHWTEANRLSARFFFANQPSIDPLSKSDAISRLERLEQTDQRTFSLTDIHVFSSTVINEFRAGVFRNRNDTKPISHFTNEQFGINNPLAGIRSDLAEIRVNKPKDVGSTLRFGTRNPKVLDAQTSYTVADTVSFTKGSHSFKAGAEFRRHQINGNLQTNQNGDLRIDKSWANFLTVGKLDSKGRARQFDSISLDYGETARGFRMSDYSLFLADDWKVSRSLTLNLGLRYEFLGHPWEVNGLLNNFDFDEALATGQPLDAFIFASNFDASSLPNTPANIRRAGNRTTIDDDWNNFAPRFGFAWAPKASLVLRGGYGIFYERITGAFFSSMRQAPPFFREAELDKQGDWNAFPQDSPFFPIPEFVVGFDDGEPQLATASDPGTRFEAYEAQVIPPSLPTPYVQQWNFNVQWELQPNFLLQVGYVGTKGSKLIQIANLNQPLDVEAVGFLPRPGAPGGGFSTNYYDIVDDQFVPSASPPCDITDDPSDCVIDGPARVPLLGFDPDEGANRLSADSNSIYNALQVSMDKRFASNYMFNVNYTLSNSIDTFSDEAQFQIENDQRRPYLNRGPSDFDRRHRLIMSWRWDVPWNSYWVLNGWSLSGIGTLQSGRPFSIIDSDLSGFLFAAQAPRPNLAPGATHQDLITSGPTTSRLDGYLNSSALLSAGAGFGNLGRNIVRAPGQQRFDLAASKMSKLTERTDLEFRAEFYNAFNTPTFRAPEHDMSEGDFGEISSTRGGPRVIQLGLKLRF